MTTKELIKRIDLGEKPIIEFTEGIENMDSADSGMFGRIINYHSPGIWERGTETIEFTIDMSEFIEYNKSIAKPIWYDNDGNLTLTWFESKYYPKNHRVNICEMVYENFIECVPTTFVLREQPKSKYFEMFLAQSAITNYVVFLENLLDNGNV